jgi:tripartite-type tricarboxylate transporter receptor subunit TctC
MMVSGPASADDVADFFKGKSINLICGAGVGGPYDNMARTFAKHAVQYIPGNPAIIVQNMVGASHLRATEYLYNVAPRNGTALGVVQSMVVLNKMIDPSFKFEPDKFLWLGRVQPLSNVGIVWHTAGVRTLEDVRKKEVIFGANSGIGNGLLIPIALNKYSATKFRVVTGYASQTDVLLAMERGEVQGNASVAIDDLRAKSDWIGQKISILFNTSTERMPDFPEVPALTELASTDEGRAVLQAIGNMSDIGQTVIAPPDVPTDRARALQDAFTKVAQDPAFIEEATKRSLRVIPLTGEQVTKLVQQNMALPTSAVESLRTIAASQSR